MTRRHLFKLILASPLAALVPRPVVVRYSPRISMHGGDPEMITRLFDEHRKEITAAIAKAIQGDSDRKLKAMVTQDTQEACNALKASDKRLKIYNIHNNGYRILGEKPQLTHFDEDS
jgi:hypothetical protein